MHKSITLKRVMRLVKTDDYRGICLECGNGVRGVESDAEGYKCAMCGMSAVMGVENLLMSIACSHKIARL